LLISRITVLDI